MDFEGVDWFNLAQGMDWWLSDSIKDGEFLD